MGSRPPNKLMIERTIDASPETVFAAFVSADALKQWWCPEGYHASEVSVDAHVGGQYQLTMKPTSGTGPDVSICGEYREIQRPTRLVMTHMFEQGSGAQFEAVGLIGHTTLLTIVLSESAGQTVMSFTQEEIPTGAFDLLTYGWSGILSRLAVHAEAVP